MNFFNKHCSQGPGKNVFYMDGIKPCGVGMFRTGTYPPRLKELLLGNEFLIERHCLNTNSIPGEMIFYALAPSLTHFLSFLRV